MTGWVGSKKAIVSSVLAIGIFAALCGSSQAFPMLRAPMLQAEVPAAIVPDAGVARQEPANLSQSEDGEVDERSPVVILIGAREHLFDGQFLCRLSDMPSLLSRIL
ncbi:hypothetical protein SAMN04515647_3313 [Cohaesibacter sp. ES.047]|uniref:hypothetical protein n=1 Tax=Cohaesibacter sp. ES.047 TaxID=1798205 RepID=UPI000BBFA1B0|nr:hypothetical protein [Cohaesibacter sp. ES.047]SNY93040.1 hypothetical protein SAMN04515647_3313 [Cohaesibacter sp. ES.047]